MNAHSSLPPPSSTQFLEGGDEIPTKLGRGSNFKKICMGNQKRKGRRNAKVVGRFFHFLTISYDGN